jgi:hypothetical protein
MVNALTVAQLRAIAHDVRVQREAREFSVFSDLHGGHEGGALWHAVSAVLGFDSPEFDEGCCDNPAIALLVFCETGQLCDVRIETEQQALARELRELQLAQSQLQLREQTQLVARNLMRVAGD